jgi:hypothetical protein
LDEIDPSQVDIKEAVEAAIEEVKVEGEEYQSASLLHRYRLISAEIYSVEEIFSGQSFAPRGEFVTRNVEITVHWVRIVYCKTSAFLS